MNILDYVKHIKNETFTDEPFNAVDALIFAEMGYINFGESVKGDDLITLHKLVVDDDRAFYRGSYNAVANKKLFNLIKDTRRYGDVKVGYCYVIDDLTSQTQFAAVTFILPKGEAYISFRGTDTSINGIKEDLLIAYEEYIPGAKAAADYLEKLISIFNGNFYLGGHSKGGNLALYSAFTLDEKSTSRLIKAYSFDGPGFKGKIEDFENWETILPKVDKFITSNDMIGVIYNKIKTAKTVFSTGKILGGHDLFTWQVDLDYNDFIYMQDRSVVSKQHEQALMNWLETMSDSDKKLAVEVLCEFMGEAKTPLDLVSKALKNFSDAKSKWNNYSIAQKKRVKRIYLQLAKYYVIAYTPKILLSRKNKKAEENQPKQIASKTR